MAHLYRLIAVIFLGWWLWVPDARASFPPPLKSCEASKPSTVPAEGALTQGCGGYADPPGTAYPFSSRPSGASYCEGGPICPTVGMVTTQFWTRQPGGDCPSGSHKVDGVCQCLPDYVQEGDSCKPPPDKCDVLKDKPFGGTVWVEMGSMSREAMWGLSGTTMTICPPEACRVSGTVEGCARNPKTGATFCDVAGGKYTGSSCTPPPPNQDPPPPGEPPFEDQPPSTCPSGKCPGTVNGVSMCVPCGETADPPPKPPEPPTPPSSTPSPPTPPGGGSGGGGGNNTTTTTTNNGDGTSTTTTTTNSSSTRCVGEKCTTTTTTTTTSNTTSNSTGASTKPPTTTSNTTQSEENRDDFCRKNPTNVGCKGRDSVFGGSCGGNYVCEGDAIQCAMARDQLRRNCQAFEAQGTSEEAAYAVAKGRTGVVTGDNPNNATFDVSVFGNNSPLPTTGAGVSDLTISVAGRSVTLPFSEVNEALDWLGMLLVAVAWIAAYRIVTGGS